MIEQTGFHAGRANDLTAGSTVTAFNMLTYVASDGTHLIEVGAFPLSNGSVYPFYGPGPAAVLGAALVTGRTISLDLATTTSGTVFAKIVQLN